MPEGTSLGKRKRRSEVARDGPRDQSVTSATEAEDVNEIFRRAFEANFQPLREQPSKDSQEAATILQEESLSEEDDQAWSGLSEDEAAVQVVQHSANANNTATLTDKEAKRAFMSSRPPSSVASRAKPTHSAAAATPGTDEAANLANDIALHRLLHESHLLAGDASEGPTGRNRLKAAELRMQSLGAKSNILEQKKMPMAHRKGIEAKARRKEDERRQQAKENGVVLERPTSKRKDVGRRERGFGGPSIGRFRGGTLSLSRKDVQGLTGGARGRGRGRGGGRSRGRH